MYVLDYDLTIFKSKIWWFEKQQSLINWDEKFISNFDINKNQISNNYKIKLIDKLINNNNFNNYFLSLIVFDKFLENCPYTNDNSLKNLTIPRVLLLTRSDWKIWFIWWEWWFEKDASKVLKREFEEEVWHNWVHNSKFNSDSISNENLIHICSYELIKNSTYKKNFHLYSMILNSDEISWLTITNWKHFMIETTWYIWIPFFLNKDWKWLPDFLKMSLVDTVRNEIMFLWMKFWLMSEKDLRISCSIAWFDFDQLTLNLFQ